MPFSGLAPSKLKILSKKLRVGYVYIEDRLIPFSIWVMVWENCPWAKGLQNLAFVEVDEL